MNFEDLVMRAYKQGTSNLLADQFKGIRHQKSKKLLYSYGQNNLNKFYSPMKKYLPQRKNITSRMVRFILGHH